MKRLLGLSIAIALTLLCIAVDARRILWQPEVKPPVLLEEALKLAQNKLKDRGEFYCIGAELAKTFSQGDWELQMSSGKEVTFASVGSDRSVRISDRGFSYK